MQSLPQLLPPAIFREAEPRYGEAAVPGVEWTIPCVEIEDAPRFAWRAPASARARPHPARGVGDHPGVGEAAGLGHLDRDRAAGSGPAGSRPGHRAWARAADAPPAGSGSFDIALYGSRGRRGLTKVLFGSVAARLARAIPCSLLVVRKTPEPVKRILIRSTLDPCPTAPIEIGKSLARAVSADSTILHVMSQIPLVDQASLDQLELTAEEAIARRTREGQALLDAQQELQAAGLQTHSVIRHGLVIDEILDEVVSGDYDLLVIGSHAGPRTNRWQDILVEDITNTVLLDTRCPVLIVRERKIN